MHNFFVEPAGGAMTTYELGQAPLEGNYVPIPGAVWLLGSGLFALIGIRKKIQNP